MKTLLTSVGSLLIGLAIGWYIEHRHMERRVTELIEQMLASAESSDREKAARAVRAIEMIGAGNTRQAIQLLSSPIAHYYSLYADAGRTNEQSIKLRTLIEQLARTNQVVAARIAEASTNAGFMAP